VVGLKLIVVDMVLVVGLELVFLVVVEMVLGLKNEIDA